MRKRCPRHSEQDASGSVAGCCSERHSLENPGKDVTLWGVANSVAMDGYLAEFRAEASGAHQLSELEEKIIRLLPQQTEEFRGQKLA